ncbi:MAG TPA: ABC transporter permease [Puia sp.]|uniref:ABC transporter permease n=1 Tax=Puia sp. TaxID=2045100 RepID=UPI002BA6F796|nr:ABC transporter permease [Puia sp.]HVU98419.1 ABC transporter permease [Puia sp.]
MFRNYLKLTWRNLNRNKVSSVINIGGLTIGLACVILIGLYVKDELGYDRFFPDTARIYRVNTHEKIGSNEFTAGHTPPPAAKALADQFPEIESYTRIFLPGDQLVRYTINNENHSITDKHLLAVDSNFLSFFGYPVLEGDKNTCLNNPNSIVLTQRAARRYFGDASPLGKNLQLDGYSTPFVVTALLNDLPEQSSLQFEALLSVQAMPAVKHFSWSWVWLQMGSYVKLKPGLADAPAVIRHIEAGTPAMIRVQAASAFSRIGQPIDEFIRKGNRYDLQLQPLSAVHLYSATIGNRYFPQGDIKYVYIFSAIGLFIILLACVNFMNLATAQSARRAREVGIRKVLGSERKQLMLQFLGEAFVYTLIAAVIAVALASLALPAFNDLSGKSLNLSAFFDLSGIAGILVLILLTAALAGSYPAIYLTSFSPATVMKSGPGGKDPAHGFFTRNTLVVFQFTVSMVLINCTVIVYKQMRFEQSKDLGFDKGNLVVVSGAEKLGSREESFRQELLRLPGITGATISTGLPAMSSFFQDTYVPQEAAKTTSGGDRREDLVSFIVDDDFIPTMKMDMAAGRNFSKSYSDSPSVILNMAAATLMGWKDPIGKHIIYPGGDNTRFTVIGVIKDFHFESLRNPIGPFALFYNTSKTYSLKESYLAVRIRPGDPAKAIAAIRGVWKGFTPENPFEYSFLDAEYDSLYKADATIGKVFGAFTMLSLVVACLGLLGLALYTAERRTKEIGIRKVLGASVPHVVAMLSKEFLKLVALAALIAVPIGWYAMYNWLQDFAYQTTLDWWIFGLTAVATTFVALATVSFQSVKAGLANPVQSLRSE